MRNALQDQLLKAGLAKKSKVDQIAREQARQRQAAKGGTGADEDAVDAERLRRDKAERDRALQAERNALAKQQELRAQARQIIEQNALPAEGDSDYRFTDGNAIRSVLVTPTTRAQLARGAVVIVRRDTGYALLPRAAADKLRDRDPTLVVVDHAGKHDTPSTDDSDPYYSRFVVPDDLVW